MSQLLLGVGRGVAAVAVGGFTDPTSDATSIHWWDASHAASISGSGGSLAVADRIGSAALGTSSNNEPGSTKTINGLNALVFDGTERMWTSGIADFGDTFHFFMVGEIGAVNNSADPLVLLGVITGGDGIDLRANSSTQFDGRLALSNVGPASFNLTGGPYSGLVLAEIVANVSTGNIEVFINGMSRGSASGYTGFTTATPAVMIFSSGGGTNEMGGTLCEMVLCSAPRTSADLTAMRNYLNTKWGL